MRADLLHVVTCHANPMRWPRREELTRQFLEHMQASGVHTTLVEVAYGERPFTFEGHHGIHWIGTRANSMAWSKESALNVGIRALPTTANYVAWIDADIEFRNKRWAEETVHALQMQPVVQPWSEAVDLGPDGEVMTVKSRQLQRSFGWVWREVGKVIDWWKDEKAYTYPHSGYAWAATMEFLDEVGLLLDFSGLGAADHQMSLGMVGHIDHACHRLSSPSYKAAVEAWGRRAFAACQGHLGYVQGRIEHQWHGEKALRKYVERWDILNRHGFDPITDVHRNRYGILELSNNKPALRREVEAYFRARNENANVRQMA